MWRKIWSAISAFGNLILRRKKTSGSVVSINTNIPLGNPPKSNSSVQDVTPKPKPLTKEQELIEVLKFAEAEGFDKWIPYVQAWHETSGFKKVIGKYNYWGIKVPKTWTGKIHKIWTTEYIKKPQDITIYGNDYNVVREDDKGIWIKLPQKFIDFNSAQEALAFWTGLVRRLKVYRKSYERRHDYKKFFKFLKAWATDPKYAEKNIALYRELKKKGKLK